MAPLGRLDRKLDGSAEERLLLLPLPAQDGWEGGQSSGLAWPWHDGAAARLQPTITGSWFARAAHRAAAAAAAS